MSKQKTFGNGEIFDAFSRAKNMNSLYLSQKKMKSQPSEHANTFLDYERHRKEIYFLKIKWYL